MAQDVAVTEAAVTIDRERRVIRYPVVEIEPAEPSVGEVQLDLLTQPPLGADAVTVTDNQHPQHELGVDRGPADVAVERGQHLAQVSQHPRHDRIDPAEQMVRRNAPFEVEQIEQLALIAPLPTHHGKPPPLEASSRRNHGSSIIARPFSTASTQSEPPVSPLSKCHQIEVARIAG